MRALTVQQPWATAIVEWGKSPENRTRNIAGSYRGPLAIHAGKTVDEGGFGDARIVAAMTDASWFGEADDGRDPFPLGAIIGVVDLWAVHFGQPGCCRPWGETDCWHLCVRNQRRLTEPIRCRGALGLWTPPADVLDRLQVVA